MPSDTQLIEQIAPYEPWLIIAGVFVLFMLLRATRKRLRRRVDEIGCHMMHERGLLLWFWINAPGVIIHELSHALVVLLFTPFGFRITNITLFRVRAIASRDSYGRVMRSGGRQSLQLGEVQYARPQGSIMSYIGDGFSGIAPLFGGTLMFILLYWIATGYSLWDIPYNAVTHTWQILRPGWPWWTLIFAPYLILTVTSELWPSRQDWHGARWLVYVLTVLLILALFLVWYSHQITNVLAVTTSIASHIDFALIVLLALDIIFLLAAEAIVQAMRQ